MTSRYFILFLLITLVTNELINTNKQSNIISAGPIPNCPYGKEQKILKRISKADLYKFDSCYDYNLNYLANNNLLAGKITWIKRTQDLFSAEAYIIDALDQLGSNKELHIELAKIYVRQKQWHDALVQIDLADVKVNSKLRLLIETNTGKYSEGTNLDSLPFIYKNQTIKHAKVNKVSSSFNLQRISDGNIYTINGEPSITTSPDGQNIWLLWTDSGQSATVNGEEFNFWSIQSSQSTDGGDTWSNISMNTIPERVDRFHFDPMSIYDPVNNIIYAGGMMKGFGPNWGATADDAMFVYRWELDNNSTLGPFKTMIPAPDKGWLATNSTGDVYLAHMNGIDLSTDKAQSFNRIATRHFTSAHIRFTNDDCLFITDLDKVVNCDNEETEIFGHTFSSVRIADNDNIPGTFRAFPFVQNIMHQNGEIYVVYYDYKFTNSTDITIFMAKSGDKGVTWSDPWIISENITGDQFAPWIEIDKFGGMHVIFFDSRNTGQSDNATDATLDVYYQYSNDLGLTWQETRVTPTSFTTPELIWGDYFFSDYISLAVSDNHVYLAFPWSTQDDQMHMYFAKKEIIQMDLIFKSSFD